MSLPKQFVMRKWISLKKNEDKSAVNLARYRDMQSKDD